MKIAALSFCIIVLSFYKIHAQSSTDAESMFKMWLFLDKENVQYRNTIKIDKTKDIALFSIFNNTVDFKIDTLKSAGLDNLGYSFYSLNLTIPDR